ncbi:AAA family ATPase [Halanaerobium congolense]|jgi:DNA sulfur modification protein DndD|uniref:Nuclease SbcCD subunit C n=1 Tax=Halanaerobium congolense TaxID=54121 RepID=A0A4R7DWJ0_9FIRM|nr:AAA family ATPase [Halanaerobium congolense]TDS26197.1 DNA sulfur modification protein DndD [Halanaerobium congolense]SDK99825.1 DNA sulfur modification protein DndD [Halanaerobium congolense]SDN05680.1 DNA sulfur modification protein DndD [Halanaerobium congolense]
MIINKIKFKNFMAYYGEIEFDFPIHEDKNVSIIYASNDTGKSCFFKGITFAMYGTNRGEQIKDLVNVNALNENNYEAFVSIFGEHNNKKIQITRTIDTKNNLIDNPSNNDFREELEVFENNSSIVGDNYKEKYDYINSIVQEDASKYFFFDGEKIEAYNIASKTEYKEPIMRILGIKEIENAKGDFITLEKEYEDKRDKLFAKKKELSDTIKEKNNIEDEIETLNKDVGEYNNNLREIKKKIVKLEDELKKHDEVQKKINRKQELRSELDRISGEIAEIKRKRNENFKENSTLILGIDMFENLKNKHNFNFEDDNFYNFNDNIKSFLNYLKKGEKCICGNNINKKEVNNIDNYIKEKIENDEEIQKKQEIKNSFAKLSNFSGHAALAKSNHLQFSEEIIKLKKQYNEFDEEFIKLKKEVGSFDSEANARIGEKITQLENKQDNIKELIAEKKAEMRLKEDKLKNIKNELSKYSSTDSKFTNAEDKLNLASNVKNIFSEYLEKLTKSKKEEVEDRSTEIFLNLTNKKRKYKGLILSDDYELKVELNDGTTYEIEPGKPLNPSTGQSKIISLSYIAGINQSSNSQAPIVIDNPLGLFSDEHRERVTEYIPKFGEQVIFMVTEADLNYKYKKIIEPYVNCEYYLQDDSNETWNKTKISERIDH